MSEHPTQPAGGFEITIERRENFEFEVRFDRDHYPVLHMDEPAPLGRDSAPNPARVLAAAIGNCLSASLLFCARKSRIEIGPLAARVQTELVRNQRGRLRIARIEVEIDPAIPPEAREKALRCLDLFEDFCVVTQSVREGIDVAVRVKGLSV